MKYLKFFLTVIVLFTGVSCKKLLDTQPADFLSPGNYYTTELQLNSALSSVYDILNSSSLYGLNMLARLGLEADEGYYGRSTYTTGVQVYNFTTNTAEVNNLWRDLYAGISRANVVLANADRNTNISEDIRTNVKGQALFLRGYYYFLLVQNFGGVPLILEPATSTEGNDVARASDADTYKQILADMEKAESMVPEITTIGFGGKISKSAIQGTLARVCLYMAGKPMEKTEMYNTAYQWASKVIKKGIHSLNPSYSQVFINYAQDKYDIKESIWEVEFWGNTAGTYNEVGYVGSANGIPSASTTIGLSYGYLNVTAKLFNAFRDQDLRKSWNVAPFTYTATGTKTLLPTNPTEVQKYNPRVGKFRREYELVGRANYFTPQNFPLLRYSDVLLMAAEALNNMNGPTVEAIDYVNIVRRRGYGLPLGTASTLADLTPTESSSKLSFLEVIKAERSRELCFEGLRKPDLIRWGVFVPTMKGVLADIATFSTTTYFRLAFLNVSDRNLILPIPEHEISVNKALVQNANW